MSGRKYDVYSEFKPSEGGWLGDIPAHWSANRLKFLSRTFASNVDKKTKDGELPIRLCNYTDVYYNDVVSPDLPFMNATATREQIEKFTLRAGDTIITKDSEDPNDIAVPAFVKQDMPGVICGYHLSIVRPTPIMSPDFLNKIFQCAFARAYFATKSNGLTRYGLGGQALSSVVFPVPPLEEQTQIAAFLDYETAKIDALIEKQRQLIALLKEKRQAVISHAVTKGLNPDAPMRDSGVEWLGEVPAHWEVVRAKYLLEFVTSGSRGWAEFYSDTGALFFRIANLTRDTIKPKLLSIQNVTPPYGSEGERSRIKEGDLLISITADLGSVCVADETITGGYVSQHVSLCRPNYRVESSRWFGYVILSNAVKEQLLGSGYGGTKIQLSLEDIRELLLVRPNPSDQKQIADYLDTRMTNFSKLISASESQVELLAERRTALISAAVTGKIDVRGWTAPDAEAVAA